MAHLLFFGRVSDLTGCDCEQVALPDHITNLERLRDWMDSRFSTGGAFLDPTIRIAIDNEICTETDILSQAQEVAFLPPVGGG